MLKTIDVLIGLSVVMLLVSMAVTVLTQSVLALRNWRGKHLLRGIEAILAQIDPELKDHAGAIGKAVLTHPMVGHLTGKMGSVIAREELVRVLMELAAGKVPAPDPKSGMWRSVVLLLSGEEGAKELTAESKKALCEALVKTGIDQPAQVLENIQSAALKLEGANPEMAAHVRHTIATVQEAPGVFVARLNSWFDQTMDRVTHAFTYNARRVTAVCSLIVAFGLQLDAINLFKRLSTDEELRKAVAGQYATVLAAYEKSQSAGQGQPDDKALTRAKESLQEFSVTGYEIWPEKWEAKWERLPGILLSTILLSLGAPFWFNALKNLISLRPLLAGKDDTARAERNAEQKPPAAAAPPPAPTGERGDLTAAG